MTATNAFAATPSVSPSHWLKRYYGVRALVSALWVALALTLGKGQPLFGIALLIVYPAWDSLANYADARRNGGLRANPTQALNAVVSATVALAVIIAIAIAAGRDLHAAIGVIGVWATLSGILQLSTGIRRWRDAGAQWPQILSGAQSALAGVHFLVKALDPSTALGVADVAPYAAFGALYFALSFAVLALRR